GENYLIPVDADIPNKEKQIQQMAIAANDILTKMETAKTRLNLIFLDACRDNPFPTRSVARGLAKMELPTGSGTMVIFATNPGNVAQDGEGRNGTYTKHLLRYINNPGLEIGQMLRQIRAAVMEETKGQQIPWDSNSMVGDFYFK